MLQQQHWNGARDDGSSFLYPLFKFGLSIDHIFKLCRAVSKATFYASITQLSGRSR